jgi:hypothetical protein
MKPREHLSEDVVGVYNHGAEALNLRARLVLEGRRLIILNNDGELLSSWPLREIRDITPPDVVNTLRLALNKTEERLNVSNPAWAEEIRSLSLKPLAAIGSGSGSRNAGKVGKVVSAMLWMGVALILAIGVFWLK